MNKNIFVTLIILVLNLTTLHIAQAAIIDMELDSAAGYPFACYRGTIVSAGENHQIEGKLTVLYYGFTKLTESEFLKTENPSWYNFKGEPVAQGFIDLNYRHNGGYKGQYILPSFQIETPDGMNLIYRLGYVKIVEGNCNSNPDQIKREYQESRVFFKKSN